MSKPRFSGADLKMVAYRHPSVHRKSDEIPCCTFFGRTQKGGFFAGLEVCYDPSSMHEQQLVLEYAPNLNVVAREKVICEPVYFGVYRRGVKEHESKGLPMASESRRHGLP